jgi:hypothetical protein
MDAERLWRPSTRRAYLSSATIWPYAGSLVLLILIGYPVSKRCAA